jgi:hypothetical protein
MGGRAGEFVGHPCSRCGLRMGARRWAYVYGRSRRGVSPRTGESDHRPLGTDEVELCRPCERSILTANLKELARTRWFELASAAATGVALLLGWRVGGLIEGAWVGIVAAALSALVAWAVRRPKAMRMGVFLSRRPELARQHGLEPREIEAYLDVSP